MNHKELYNLLKTVRQNIRCPQCGKQYKFTQIKIRGIADFIVFLELSCDNHMPVLATVALSKKTKGTDDDKNVVIDMTLTAPGCPMADFITEDVKQKVQSIDTINEVTINIVFDPPWDKSMMSEEALLELGYL